ncbi:protein translocase subunit SecD [uncultured Marinobacter sp.]|uniref:protein translocase subunit SecD n=1 Tax=uncultured Marinobacter sp. TaxID=187379 RepID=UPI0030DD1444
MKSLSSRAVVYSLLILLGLLSAMPNLLPPSVAENLPDWYTETTLSLGLDLSGGSHLLLEVDTRELIATAAQEKGKPLSAAELEALSQDAVERSLEVVRRRLDETGLVEPSITRQGSDSILVQMPGVADPGQIRELLGTTARMTFHWVAEPDSRGQVEVITLPADESRVGDGKAATGEQLYRLEKRVAMEGKHISDAQLAFHPDTSEPVVNFRLDNEGTRLFGDITRTHIGRPLAIVLDGKVITAPVIRGIIAGGSGEISGSFTPASASNLALLLRAGALPAPLDVIEERTVGPDLGSDAIAMGISTGLIGAALVVAFMLGIYGTWGLIACIGLAVNIGLVFGILSILGATLTLPGIAGIILTLGMAVDANILINERIREESRRGRSAMMALREGFDRAYRTILDSNVTTLIAVSLLFLFGSGPIRGFAVTIGIGLLTSLFTAIAVTRLLMEWRTRQLGRQPLTISGIRFLDRLSNGSLNLMRGRIAGIAVSLVLSVASIGLFVNPGLNYGIDFSGGTLVDVSAHGTTVEQLRDGLQDHGLGHAAIQETGERGYYLLRLPRASAAEVASGEQVATLKTAVQNISEEATFPKVEMVGPKVSGNFSDASILAVLLAGVGMLAYLWMRFEYHFALAATLTIALDLTKTIGFFALTGIEFNLTAVAALLALIGYSVNDKVVVFDRIRENLRLTPDKPMLELLNQSITSTLTRTLFTSVTTLLALAPMAIAGGSAVASFAQPMLFGIVIGTSSSILVASPILYFFAERRTRRGLSQLGPSAEELKQQLDLIP